MAAHHTLVDPGMIAAAAGGNNPPVLVVDLSEMRE